MKHKNKTRSGQTLLIVILIITILTTVGLSVVQNSISEQQIAELEEQSKRAFSAAESGLEAALKRGAVDGTIDVSDIQLPGIKNISVAYSTEVTSNYITPIIDTGEQFTFYFSEYDSVNNTFGNALPESQRYAFVPTDSSVASLCDSAPTAFALELTFIKKNATDSSISRRLIDPCGLITGDVLKKWVFDVPATISTGAHVLILRVVGADSTFAGSRITIKNANETDNEWIAQGKVIISEAETTTGVVKRIKLYSTYPQIPSQFFISSF